MNNPTDTNQASELFELCKEVYRRTEWRDTLAVYEQTDSIPLGEPYIAYPELERRYGLWGTQELKKRTPLYTSDYLLGKLPNKLIHDCDEYADATFYFVLNQGEEGWYTCYALNGGTKELRWLTKADTPLKALLKLTIALSEAGELR